MAEKRSYLKEKDERQNYKSNYKTKIFKHRMGGWLRIIAVLLVLSIIGIFVYLQYQNHIYTTYEIVNSVEREAVVGTTDIRLGSHIMTYSRDGAHCTDLKGNVLWNQTYEIQDVCLDVCQNVAVIAAYNGRDVFVVSDEKILGSFKTNMPIRSVAVSATGRVVVVMADTNVTYYNTYSADGQQLFSGYATMSGSGYPAYISLSPNGELMQIAYMYLDAGVQKTNVVFYNLGPVGDNATDNIVSTYQYSDILVPYVEFMNDNTAFAVGDNVLIMYKGSQKPVHLQSFEYKEEVRAVYYNEDYVGLVFYSESGTSMYRMNVYSSQGKQVGTYDFNLEYTDIIFHGDEFIVYNDAECYVMTMNKVEKYAGTYEKSIRKMIPLSGAYKYMVVTAESLDTIQLK